MGGSTLVGGPVGFPSGGHTTMIKLAEARSLVEAGAEEVDMMINLGRLKSGDLRYVQDEIKAAVEMIAPIPLKVILEVSRLTDDEIRRGSESVVEAGAAFVKTATGWTGEPTTLNHIRIIHAVVQGKCRIKASGGIRNLETIKAMLSLGVTRFGINSTVAVQLMTLCASSEGS
jgi:deoxyribose-phosphate aldolase